MRRILVIDDDVQFRKMLCQVLERAGYEVVEADNGKKGVKLFRAQPTDLVITDIIMPEQEGIETIRELKRDFPDVKIIAISGGGRIDSKDYLELAGQFGVTRTFGKPLDREEFLAALEELLAEAPVR